MCHFISIITGLFVDILFYRKHLMCSRSWGGRKVEQWRHTAPGYHTYPRADQRIRGRHSLWSRIPELDDCEYQWVPTISALMSFHYRVTVLRTRGWWKLLGLRTNGPSLSHSPLLRWRLKAHQKVAFWDFGGADSEHLYYIFYLWKITVRINAVIYWFLDLTYPSLASKMCFIFFQRSLQLLPFYHPSLSS